MTTHKDSYFFEKAGAIQTNPTDFPLFEGEKEWFCTLLHVCKVESDARLIIR